MDTIVRVIASIYSRYSSDMQRESSIADQERNCRKRAAAEGWEIGECFADKAISGTDNSRPMYLKMQQAAGRGEFSVLLIDDLSRLTRDSIEQATVIKRLKFQGIRIVAVSDGFDSAQKSSKLTAGMKGLMNEVFLDDLREKVIRGLTGQALAQRWCGSRPYGYRLRPLRDANRTDAYGEALKFGTTLEPDGEKADIVREIFQRFAQGQSCHKISCALNERHIPSPGSVWKRKVRRDSGWQSSSIRVIVRNPIYKACYQWNTSQFLEDVTPDLKRKHKQSKDGETVKYMIRRARPRSEWIVSTVEPWRIVDDELWQRAQARFKNLKNDDKRLKNGGSPKYLLSGLLKCERCGAHYVVANARGYGCSSYANGGACSNNIFVRRDALESIIISPIYDELLSPKLIAARAKDMEKDFARRLLDREQRATALPRELLELDGRLARLRARLLTGDEDLSTADIQAAIDKAQSKRSELAAAQPERKQRAKLLALLPKAAQLYRKQIKEGLMGDVRSALKARVILRGLLGEITLCPKPDGSLRARYKMDLNVLVKGVGTSGSGGRI